MSPSSFNPPSASPAVVEPELLPQLRAAGLLAADEPAELVPLRGGVSSDIVCVQAADGRKFVVKRALAKLKVKDEWLADTGRNRAEQAWFAYAARLAPAAVPRLLHRGPDWFAMEFLGGDLANWKEELLAGRANLAHARRAGAFLGAMHRVSWGDAEARDTFATGRNFHDLRIEPYLVTTGRRMPALRAAFEAEAARLAATALALVHGDFSPKNLLVGDDRLVVLDAEVAWFGDPAFDLAFLLTHLHLKALVHAARPDALLELVPVFWTSYGEALGAHADAALEARTVRLLLMLLLARVHGKSPVEYLDASRRERVTRFGSAHLPAPPDTVSSLTAAWKNALAAP